MAVRTSSWPEAALREMRLGPLWRLRARAAAGADAPLAAAGPEEVSAEVSEVAAICPPTASQVVPGRPLVQKSEGFARSPSPSLQARDDGRANRIATLGWEALEEDIGACRACPLCERRRQAVPGVGDRSARWMLVGEGPGAEEDQRGEPFVGQAGRLLDSMLATIGLARGEDVYIANAVKCRPPHNRTPERSEIASCLPYLERQIALVQPRLLVALGRPAAQALLQRELAITSARGKRFEHNGVAVVVTYHPAYLLRNPQDKAKAWEDLCFARRLMAELGDRV
ncbi:uracil-DNA glycosylase [Thauera sp. ZXT1-4]|uniref:uracil-DNA glycosylase n=1 Tax=Thauera sp. ZXT1-4 TaxID=3460294 RepID=UPI004040B9D4